MVSGFGGIYSDRDHPEGGSQTGGVPLFHLGMDESVTTPILFRCALRGTC